MTTLLAPLSPCRIGQLLQASFLHLYQLFHIYVVQAGLPGTNSFVFLFLKINMHYAVQKQTYYPGGLLQSSAIHLKIQNYLNESFSKINTSQQGPRDRRATLKYFLFLMWLQCGFEKDLMQNLIGRSLL